MLRRKIISYLTIPIPGNERKGGNEGKRGKSGKGGEGGKVEN